MISYLARTVGAGVLGLVAATSAPAMESPNYLQNTQPSTTVKYSSSTNLESRLTTDLEMARMQPLEFIKGLEEKYSKRNVKALEKEGSLDSEISYATRLVSSIKDKPVGVLALRQIDTLLGHSSILEKTIDIATSEDYSFVERKNAIEHLGYLSERGKTPKNNDELDSIANALYSVLEEDMIRLNKKKANSTDFANALSIQGLNTAHQFLQAFPKGESSQRLLKQIYDLSEASPIEHIDEHVAWILESVYDTPHSKKLNDSFADAAEKFPLSFFKPATGELTNKEIKKSSTEARKNYASNARASENSQALDSYLVGEPKWTYVSGDHLETFYERFEKVFKKGEPELTIIGNDKHVNNTLDLLDRLEKENPADIFGLKLSTDTLTVGTEGLSNASYFNRNISLSANRLNVTSQFRWEEFNRVVRHEVGHLIRGELGKFPGSSHLGEEQPEEWAILFKKSFEERWRFEGNLNNMLSKKQWR